MTIVSRLERLKRLVTNSFLSVLRFGCRAGFCADGHLEEPLDTDVALVPQLDGHETEAYSTCDGRASQSDTEG